MPYKEFIFDAIKDLRVKEKPPEPPGDGGPGGDPRPCENYQYQGDAGVHICHVNLGAAASGTGEGTWFDPTDDYPVDWQQIGPPIWNNTIKGGQRYVPGNDAVSADITVTYNQLPGQEHLTIELQWWIYRGTRWSDPNIWKNPYSVPKSDPPPADGSGRTFNLFVPRVPVPPPQNNPHNYGTTILFALKATPVPPPDRPPSVFIPGLIVPWPPTGDAAQGAWQIQVLHDCGG